MYTFGVMTMIHPGEIPCFSRNFLVNWGLFFSPLSKIIVCPIYPEVDPVLTTVMLKRLKNKAVSVKCKCVSKDIEIKEKDIEQKQKNIPISYHGFILFLFAAPITCKSPKESDTRHIS